MNLNQVTLPSRDIAESIEFYTRMGFSLIVNSPDYARFKSTSGDATFSVHASSVCNAGETLIYFECDSLDEQVAILQRREITFAQLPRDEPWLWREARLFDPSGNQLCLYHAGANRLDPPWRVKSDDRKSQQ